MVAGLTTICRADSNIASEYCWPDCDTTLPSLKIRPVGECTTTLRNLWKYLLGHTYREGKRPSKSEIAISWETSGEYKPIYSWSGILPNVCSDKLSSDGKRLPNARPTATANRREKALDWSFDIFINYPKECRTNRNSTRCEDISAQSSRNLK